MTLEEQLIAAVLAAPEQDEPRKEYARWLHAQGDPRGEFILLDCKLAQLEQVLAQDTEHLEVDLDPAILALRHQRAVLLARHKECWESPMHKVHSRRVRLGVDGTWQTLDPGASFTFIRGFVEKACLSASDVVDHAASFFSRAPIRSLRIQGIRAPLPQGPHWSRLTELMLEGSPEAIAATLAQCIGANPLQSLTLRWVQLSPKLLEQLGQLKGLKRLSLEQSKISVDAAKELGKIRGLTHFALDVVPLSGADGDAALEILLSGNLCQGLRTLEFRACQLGDGAAQRIADAKLDLHALALPWNAIGPLGVAALVQRPWLSLRSLNLGHNSLQREGASALVEGATLPALEVLRVPATGLSADGLKEILAAPLIPPLRLLDGSDNPLGDPSIAALVSSKHAASLCALRLDRAGLGESAVAAFLSPPMSNLGFVSLKEAHCTPATLRAFRLTLGPGIVGASGGLCPFWESPKKPEHSETLRAALRAVGSCSSPAAALARLRDAGLWPAGSRSFVVFHRRECPACGARGLDAAGDSCNHCEGARYSEEAELASEPATVAFCVAFAAERLAVERAEAEAALVVERLSPFSYHPKKRTLAWRFVSGKESLPIEERWPVCFFFVLDALERLGQDPVLLPWSVDLRHPPQWPHPWVMDHAEKWHRESWLELGSIAWAGARALGPKAQILGPSPLAGRTFSELADPFAPAQAIRDLGYDLISTRGIELSLMFPIIEL